MLLLLGSAAVFLEELLFQTCEELVMSLPSSETLEAVVEIDGSMRDNWRLLIAGALALIQVLLVVVSAAAFSCFEAGSLLGVIILEQDRVVSDCRSYALLRYYMLLLGQAAIRRDLSVKVAWQQVGVSSEAQILRVKLCPRAQIVRQDMLATVRKRRSCKLHVAVPLLQADGLGSHGV